MDSAHSTLKTFAGNHRQLDSGIGMTAVLHSHTRRLDYHPHVHIIVPAVTVNRQRRQCTKLRGDYLLNALKYLSRYLYRGVINERRFLLMTVNS